MKGLQFVLTVFLQDTNLRLVKAATHKMCGQRQHTLIHLSRSKKTYRELDPINQTPSSLVATNRSDEFIAGFGQ